MNAQTCEHARARADDPEILADYAAHVAAIFGLIEEFASDAGRVTDLADMGRTLTVPIAAYLRGLDGAQSA